jgi:U3 small nucleolar RNA-associated protein 11
MSSLRNAVKRVTHKERSQPRSRKRFGLLEKKKDYVERARDFQRKVGRITDLKKKAAEKNPDEFYFGMVHAKTKGGVHQAERKDGSGSGKEGGGKLTHAELRLMKDQDLTYLTMKQGVDERRARQLQDELHLMGGRPLNRHTIFVDSEAEAGRFDAAEHFDTAPELAGRAFNRPRVGLLEGGGSSSSSSSSNSSSSSSSSSSRKNGSNSSSRGGGNLSGGVTGGAVVAGPQSMKQFKKLLRQRERSYAELSQRIERADKLKRLMEHKQVEKNVMSSKGAKRKLKDAEDGKPAVYKWKRQRAR